MLEGTIAYSVLRLDLLNSVAQAQCFHYVCCSFIECVWTFVRLNVNSKGLPSWALEWWTDGATLGIRTSVKEARRRGMCHGRQHSVNGVSGEALEIEVSAKWFTTLQLSGHLAISWPTCKYSRKWVLAISANTCHGPHHARSGVILSLPPSYPP